MFARLLAEAVPRTEDASGAAGGGFHAPGPLKTHSVQQVLFCGPLKMRRVPEKAVFDTEYLSRTVGACFLHRMLLKMRRVPQEAFFDTEYLSRTVEACFWHGEPPNASRTPEGGFRAPKIPSVPQKPVSGTECLRRSRERGRRKQVPR